jgi:probable DNA metabolism protein
MYCVSLKEPHSIEEFRDAVRGLIAAEVAPEAVTWEVGATSDLFGTAAPPTGAKPLSVPAAYLPLAENVICHRDPERFALLYQLLWRITHGERSLLMVAADPLVHRLRLMQKSVERDHHKMTAFLRFRRIEDDDSERYVAWYEPEHHILRLASSFFVDRFASMRWSILTPEGSLHWDGAALTLGPAIGREHAPQGDDIEQWWKLYYRATFNPARANPAAMRAHMPKRYWRNMPETALVPDLLSQAGKRTQSMIEAVPLAPRAAHAWTPDEPEEAAAGTLAGLKAQAATCRRCPLWKPATQTVFGEGPTDAELVFVGEQPGDQEDLAGRPFVGPAGQVFDRALADVGIDRSRVYVTNAVKHFKFEARGKRRLHKTPTNAEVEHCRWWMDREIALIKPKLIVALGATAARALSGRGITIARERGRITTFGDGSAGMITVHPSYLLRLPDEAAKALEYRRFVDDLRIAASHSSAVHMAG